MAGIILVIQFLRKNIDFSVVNTFFALVLRFISRTDLSLNLILLFILKMQEKNDYQLG